MLKEIQAILDKINDNRRQYRTWQKVVSVLACITVFCTTYALILPAITLESSPDVICGKEEHTHSSECYQRLPVLICTLDHEHTDDCYVIDSVIICGKEEHKHTESCFPAEESTTEQQSAEPAAPSDTVKSTDASKTADDSGLTEETKPTEDSKAAEKTKPTEETKPTEDSKAAEKTKPTEETKPTEDSKAAEKTKPTEETKPTEDSKAAEKTKPTEETKPTEDSKAAAESKPTEETKPTEDSKAAEETKPTEETEATEEFKESEETKATEAGDLQSEELPGLDEEEIITVNPSSLRAAGLKNLKMMTNTLRSGEDAVSVDKTITRTGNNSYEITMEVYATGTQSIQITQSVMPTDIVLVLDQSGSMSDNMGNSSQTRLDVLKSAANSFVEKVVESAKGADGQYGGGDDVNHRIAIVGFAEGSNPYNNTEIIKNGTEYTYGDAANGICANAFDSMDTASGRTSVLSSISKLTAEGGTYTSYGLELAQKIFAANNASGRNRIVVLFSDGYPGLGILQWGWSANSEANAALNVSNTLKSTYKATVYSIGIFNGADRTKAGTAWSNYTIELTESASIPHANYFMHHVSSNGNNVPAANEPSYYLTPTEASGLTDIFESIAGQVSTGGSTDVSLDTQTTVVDIISDYFELPENADTSAIRVYTVNSNGLDSDNNPTFDESTKTPFNANVTLSSNNKKISVKGFNYAAHWCGPVMTNGTVSGYNTAGQKLVIVVPVKPNDDFIGGYNVPSNEDGSGVFIDNQPVPGGDFGGSNDPRIDVPPDFDSMLPDSVFSGKDLTIYAKSQTLTADSLFEGLDKIRRLKTFVENHASELNANTVYTFIIPDTVRNTASDSYTVKVEVRKKSDSSQGDSVSKTSHVYVLVPTVKFNDSLVLSGEQYTKQLCLDENLASSSWVPDNGWQYASEGGSAPAVSGPAPDRLEYTFVDKQGSTISGDNYFVYDDTAVNVTVQAKYGDSLKDVTDQTKFTWECGLATHGTLPSVTPHDGSQAAAVEFYIHAYSGVSLPATGGDGIKIWLVIGLTLMTVPIMIGLSMKRKRDLINVF